MAGHTNFLVPTHDALAHQDLGLIGLGANLLRPQIWNPFCQAYEDRTKGSLLATPGQEHNHCNLGLISICRGGDLKPFEEARLAERFGSSSNDVSVDLRVDEV